MSITETTYRPSAAKVEKKNSKYELSRALIDIHHAICDLKDGAKLSKDYAYTVGRIQAILLAVL